MKQTHIIALVLVLVAIIMLFTSSSDLSTFSTFEAAEKNGTRVKIAGQLAKQDPMIYQPEVDPNLFTFYLIDENKDKKKVIIREKKRHDFERSEQIVVTGKMNDQGEFEASEMLLKCPSKYKEEEISLRKKALSKS